jgi:hypothetical protein
MLLTRLSLGLTVFLLFLFPFVFSEVMLISLAKLHLDPGTATSIAVAVMLGGLINIPIVRIPLHDEILVHPLTVFGMSGLWPEIRRVRRETIIAVNVGGCLIPEGLASATSSPIAGSLCAEIAATWAFSLRVATGRDSDRNASIAAFMARSRPRLMSIALAPATTLRMPSANIACARIVAVLVPSPTLSPVLSAA